MRKLKLEELGRKTIEEFQSAVKNPIVVVLDSIRSALNVGSVFRTCDAFAIEKLMLCGITCAPPNREITKTAIGATESVSWEHHYEIKDVLITLKNEGYTLVGIEQTDASIMLDDKPIKDQKTALIFGNEVEGISDHILPLIDYCIEIPQFGTKHSLNVSVCCGIVLWEYCQPFISRNK